MFAPASAARVLRFDSFELDLHAGELRKRGVKLRLQGQPVQLLTILLQSAGDLVTREELRNRLWPADTFVDFDHSLHNAIARLREVLGDSAEVPRYIETLPRRGYRFIAQVEEVQAPRIDAENGNKTGEAVAVATRPKRGAGLILALFSCAAIGFAAWIAWQHFYGKSAVPPIRSIAVLPLQNLSGDAAQEYLADGMTESLITELGKISTLRVISRQSVMQYKTSKTSLQEIARELNVDAVLEGAVEHSGDRVRVSVHLERVSPESQVWANEYRRNIRDVMGFEDDIALAITDEIQVKLTPEKRLRPTSAHAVDPEAHDDYLRGRYLLGLALAFHSKFTDKEQYTHLDILAAIGHFKQAIEKDPGYALASAGLADAYIELGNPQWGGAPREALSEAKAASTKALELDPSLAEAHFSLAQALEYEWNWSEAEKEYRLALKLNPNYADAHLEYGRFVQALRRNDEAMTQMNYAIELDPFGIRTREFVAFVTYASGQYDLAVKQFENLGDDWGLVWAYREKKMYPEAIAAWQRWKLTHRSQPQRRCAVCLATLAGIYGLEGRKREAQRLIDELRELPPDYHVSSFFFAEAYADLGDKDQALTWLERAYEEHDQWMVFINSYPGLEPLRSEPRFQTLLRRMNFPS